MNQVLILTRNILAEQEIQQKLQALNYEVYCSAKIFEKCGQQLEALEFFNFFQYVILSETICESEVMELVPLLKNRSIRIIRKVETKVTEMDHQYLEEALIHAIISNEDSVDELRECLYILKNYEGEKEPLQENRKYVQLSDKVSLIRPNVLQKESITPEDNYQFLEVLHHLSTTETKILSILLQAGNQVVTRETICHQIWNEEVNKSHLASLSSTITRIKNKFEQTNLSHKAIQTLWGKGYRINQELLDRIQMNENLKKVVSNG
ncbi:helix-turn-helix domain-containing protein [Enterococcus hulanensis]|uniref:helix-turn-helix domain-containing protein n=1 Tax=Enterococcus TaxID=1350 RepID=UPI000B5A9C2E|nr:MULTISPECIES: helix-turn-helix domain-containing protein [Enterococcus]MBO0411847.1 helix-turn-helix domain-containing protein [Enterococcus hulanensis]OTO20605.1 hypothetical protein A5875_001958 [Enterococcus sp. 3H8_DIV0648]